MESEKTQCFEKIELESLERKKIAENSVRNKSLMYLRNFCIILHCQYFKNLPIEWARSVIPSIEKRRNWERFEKNVKK